MNDFSYNIDAVSSDDAMISLIGNFVKHHRLRQNRSQDEVAKSAGVSRSTLSLLERGEKTNLSSLIRVLRVLDLLYVLNAFEVVDEISPIEYAELKRKSRRYRSSPEGLGGVAEEDDLGW